MAACGFAFRSMRRLREPSLTGRCFRKPCARSSWEWDNKHRLDDEYRSMSRGYAPTIPKITWPDNDADIVRHLINQQNFDGLWNLDATDVKKLTGKPLTSFPQSSDAKLLISAIVVATLESRFTSFSALWYGVVQKARTRLITLLGQDANKLDDLLKDIEQRLQAVD